ncbi:YigZ family protein [candidate division KSB1 bacterium]|nr:MAG: YigZ family protein [candidate division KSB1 bacterium]
MEIIKDYYFTIRKDSICEIKVKGSRFIGHAFSAVTRDQAEEKIEFIRKKHHNATHNCFAYRTGNSDSSIFRFSDDGEPSGTAGRPILEAIDSRDLTDVVVIVTRYFGGTKLGTGGLARAYGGCASDVLKSAELQKKVIFQRIAIKFPYELTGQVMNTVSRTECRVSGTKYESQTEMILDVRISIVDQFIKKINDACSGRVVCRKGEVLRN